jgi:serine protease Do
VTGGNKTIHVRVWQTVALCLAVLLTGSAVFVGWVLLPGYREVHNSVARLTSEVTTLREEQTVPAVLLERYRDSICYIYASYIVERPESLKGPDRVRVSVSGSGFVVGNGLMATNKHVLQPAFDGGEASAYMAAGARPQLEKLVAFFPGLAHPVVLHGIEFSRTEDLAVARFDTPQGSAPIAPLPLTTRPSAPGDLVVVVGYPLGAMGMVAKSPQPVYERLALNAETISVVEDLAALSLIRPSSTFGHLGDVVGDKVVYDAPTAHGGSGGPVFNMRGEVIAINSAYMNGFAGGTIGFSVNALKPLIAHAENH